MKLCGRAGEPLLRQVPLPTFDVSVVRSGGPLGVTRATSPSKYSAPWSKEYRRRRPRRCPRARSDASSRVRLPAVLPRQTCEKWTLHHGGSQFQARRRASLSTTLEHPACSDWAPGIICRPSHGCFPLSSSIRVTESTLASRRQIRPLIH